MLYELNEILLNLKSSIVASHIAGENNVFAD